MTRYFNIADEQTFVAKFISYVENLFSKKRN